MHSSVQNVLQQIESTGGIQTAEILAKIFSQLNPEFGKAFDVDRFFVDVYDKFDSSLYRGMEGSELPLEPKGNDIQRELNLIPSSEPNSLFATLCLAIIKGGCLGRPRPEITFSRAFFLLCEYWFSCLKVNQENLLITPDWDPSMFEKHYESIIEKYIERQHKKVFIVEISKSGPILRYPYLC